MSKKNLILGLTDSERSNLRKFGVRKTDIIQYSITELSEMMQISTERARELYAYADFQRVPSVGIEFAKDLVFLGFYALDDLKNKDGAELTNQFELKKGLRTDPCVEDQFRLIVDFANNEDYSKRWWDFTAERKLYRETFGYPMSRPKVYDTK